MFSMSIIRVLVDAAVPSEDGIVIKWDFKSGSVERSIEAIKHELAHLILQLSRKSNPISIGFCGSLILRIFLECNNGPTFYDSDSQ
jgi:hypothetical protein